MLKKSLSDSILKADGSFSHSTYIIRISTRFSSLPLSPLFEIIRLQYSDNIGIATLFLSFLIYLFICDLFNDAKSNFFKAIPLQALRAARGLGSQNF
jgi:hypothetical protein